MKKDKLHKIAPILSDTSLKKNAFKVPENYFSTVEDAFFSERNLNTIQSKDITTTFNTPSDYFDSVEEITITKLKASAIKSDNNSEIPNDYFDTFEDRVLAKLNKSKKVISLKSAAKYLVPISIAASLLFFVILRTDKTVVSFDSLATNEIEQFIESGLVDINTFTLSETFSEIDLETNNFEDIISDEEVLNYLTVEDLETIIYEN